MRGQMREREPYIQQILYRFGWFCVSDLFRLLYDFTKFVSIISFIDVGQKYKMHQGGPQKPIAGTWRHQALQQYVGILICCPN